MATQTDGFGNPVTPLPVPDFWRSNAPTIPDWVPPNDTGRPPQDDLNFLARAQRINTAAINTVIPIVYGRDRVAGKPFVIHVDEPSATLFVAYGFCEGEIEGFENFFIDNEEAGAEDGFLDNDGVITAYLGTADQTADATLAAVIPGYADACPGLAYAVLTIPKDSTRGFPRVEAIIKGRKLYDPRLDSTNGGSGLHRVDDPTTWEYSDNPTLAFADFSTQRAGWPVDWDSVIENASANDELVGGVARRVIGLTMATAAPAPQWAQGFRTYMGAYLSWEDGKLRIIPDRADVEAPYGVVFNRNKVSNPYDYIEVPFSADLNVGSGDFAVSASVIPDRLGVTAEVMSRYVQSTEAGWFFGVTNTNTMTLEWTTPSTAFNQVYSGVVPFEIGKATRLGVNIDRTAGQAQFYVDGLPFGAPVAFSVVGSPDSATAPFRIGGLNNNLRNYFGVIDEVQLWSRKLTSAEHLHYLTAEVDEPGADLLAYYKLNSLSGSVVTDYSVYGNNGAFVGTPSWALGDTRITPTGVVKHFTADDIREGGLQLRYRNQRQFPNSIIIEYADTRANPWRKERVQVSSPRVESGAERPRVSRISLPGLHDPSQAYREAVERLNWFLSDLEATLTVFDEGLRVSNGSIITVSHPMGLVAKLFRVRRVSGDSGRWTLDLAEYDPAMYSNAVISSPTTPDVVLGNPLRPPQVTSVTAVEELFKYRNGITGSRIRVTWTAPNYAFLSQFIVEGYVNGVQVFQTFTRSNEAVTPGVEELVLDAAVTYEVRVYVQSSFNVGLPVSQFVTVLGKLAPPGDVPSLSAEQIAADQVSLRWAEATDIDIWGYEIRVGSVGQSWNNCTQLELVDGLTYIATFVDVGTYVYHVKARDSVGNESRSSTTAQITIAAPVGVASLNGFEVAGEVRLSWQPPVGAPYIARYRVAYSDVPETFERTLDIVDTLTFNTKEVAEGTYTFKVYAIDGAGRETAAPATRQIEVTSDADAFLADTYEFNSPTLTNMHQYFLRTDSRQFYVTAMGNAFLASPSSFSTYAAEPLANYHTSGSSEWLSETKDFGLLLTGNWILEPDVQALAGTVTVALELSEDNVSWDVTSGTGQVSAKGTYRYARVRISTTTTSTAYVIAAEGINLNVKVVPLEESGSVTSNATAGVTVTLSRTYTALKEINATPVNTNDAALAVVDNIVLGNPSSFDVYVFDIFGQQLAVPVQWKWKAV